MDAARNIGSEQNPRPNVNDVTDDELHSISVKASYWAKHTPNATWHTEWMSLHRAALILLRLRDQATLED